MSIFALENKIHGMMTKKINYLIAGTGGVGGSIAGFLALAGKDVSCIARGAHLQAIREQGLKLKSDLKGTHYLRIPACTSEEFTGKADVIFVCVKGYSIESIAGFLQKAAHKAALITAVLNVYGTEDIIQTMVNKYRKYMKRTKQLIPNIRIKPCPLPPHTTTPQQQPKHSTKQFSQKPVFLPFHRKSGDYRKKYRNLHLQSR